MYKKLWNEVYRSVCSISFYNEKGIKLNATTGFKYAGFLITDKMVFKTRLNPTDVQIRFYEADGQTIRTHIEWSMEEFEDRLLGELRDTSAGFAAIKFDDPAYAEIPSLHMDENRTNPIGTSIVVVGYQVEHKNICMKTGIVSSFCQNKKLNLIQFEAGIQNGMSGAPLINAENGHVIGISGFKLAQMHDTYNKLNQLMNDNLTTLKQAEGKIFFDNIDLFQVLIANQNQIKSFATELFKNRASTGGLALNIAHVEEFFRSVLFLNAYRSFQKTTAVC